VALTLFSLTPPAGDKDADRKARYMPVPGRERGDANELNRMEEEWNNRLTYPTGIFNPAWLKVAAAQDSLIRAAIPNGVPLKSAAIRKSAPGGTSPLALNSSGFTALGPAPLS